MVANQLEAVIALPVLLGIKPLPSLWLLLCALAHFPLVLLSSWTSVCDKPLSGVLSTASAQKLFKLLWAALRQRGCLETCFCPLYLPFLTVQLFGTLVTVLVMGTRDWKCRRVLRFREMMSLNLLRWCLSDNLFSKLCAKCRQRGTSECPQGWVFLMLLDHSHCGVGVSPSVLLWPVHELGQMQSSLGFQEDRFQDVQTATGVQVLGCSHPPLNRCSSYTYSVHAPLCL